MMKKIMMTLLAAVMCIGMASARDTYSRNAADLPAAARSFISNNFKAKVSLIKIDKGLIEGTDYDVVLSDGSEVDFDSKGNWESIEVPAGKSVPAKVIPEMTSRYIKQNHPGQKVVGIEREHNGFSIELANGIEFKTDRTGTFKKYDD